MRFEEDSVKQVAERDWKLSILGSLRVPVRFVVLYLKTHHPRCSCVPSHEQLLTCRHSIGRELSLACIALSGE